MSSAAQEFGLLGCSARGARCLIYGANDSLFTHHSMWPDRENTIANASGVSSSPSIVCGQAEKETLRGEIEHQGVVHAIPHPELRIRRFLRDCAR